MSCLHPPPLFHHDNDISFPSNMTLHSGTQHITLIPDTTTSTSPLHHVYLTLTNFLQSRRQYTVFSLLHLLVFSKEETANYTFLLFWHLGGLTAFLSLHSALFFSVWGCLFGVGAGAYRRFYGLSRVGLGECRRRGRVEWDGMGAEYLDGDGDMEDSGHGQDHVHVLDIESK